MTALSYLSMCESTGINLSLTFVNIKVDLIHSDLIFFYCKLLIFYDKSDLLRIVMKRVFFLSRKLFCLFYEDGKNPAI